MPDGEVLGPTEQAVGAAAAAARRGRGGGGPQDVVRSGGVEQTVDEPAPDVAESVGRHAVGVRRDQDDAAVRLDLVQRLEPHLQLRDHSTHFITNTNLYVKSQLYSTSLCSALTRPSRLSTRHCPHLLLNGSCPRGAQQQTRRKPRRLSNNRTDGRTDARPLHKLVGGGLGTPLQHSKAKAKRRATSAGG